MTFQVIDAYPEQCPFPVDSLPLYAQPSFITAFQTAYHSQAFYKVVLLDQKPVALFPVFRKRKLGLTALGTPQLYYYHPIVFSLNEGLNPNRAMQRKLEILRELALHLKSNYTKMQFNLAPEVFDVRGFTWSGLEATPLYTFRVNLKHVSEMDYFINERNSIHKAAKSDMDITHEFAPDLCISLANLTNKRQHRLISLSDQEHSQLLHDLHQTGNLVQFVARFDDHPIATYLVLTDRLQKTIYAWQHYSDPAALKTGISPYLTDYLFRSFRDEFDWFDFCGANHPSISRLKAALGAELHVFFRIRKDPLPKLKI